MPGDWLGHTVAIFVSSQLALLQSFPLPWTVPERALRTARPRVHVCHPVHVTRHPDRGLVAGLVGHLTIQGHGPIPGRDGHLALVDQQQIPQHGANLVSDVLIGPQEYAQQVPAADYPEQVALGSHHRKQPDPVLVHPPRGRGQWRVRVDGDGRCGHQLRCGIPATPPRSPRPP